MIYAIISRRKKYRSYEASTVFSNSLSGIPANSQHVGGYRTRKEDSELQPSRPTMATTHPEIAGQGEAIAIIEKIMELSDLDDKRKLANRREGQWVFYYYSVFLL
jgi:hypothetical protein